MDHTRGNEILGNPHRKAANHPEDHNPIPGGYGYIARALDWMANWASHSSINLYASPNEPSAPDRFTDETPATLQMVTSEELKKRSNIDIHTEQKIAEKNYLDTQINDSRTKILRLRSEADTLKAEIKSLRIEKSMESTEQYDASSEASEFDYIFRVKKDELEEIKVELSDRKKELRRVKRACTDAESGLHMVCRTADDMSARVEAFTSQNKFLTAKCYALKTELADLSNLSKRHPTLVEELTKWDTFNRKGHMDLRAAQQNVNAVLGYLRAQLPEVFLNDPDPPKVEKTYFSDQMLLLINFARNLIPRLRTQLVETQEEVTKLKKANQSAAQCAPLRTEISNLTHRLTRLQSDYARLESAKDELLVKVREYLTKLVEIYRHLTAALEENIKEEDLDLLARLYAAWLGEIEEIRKALDTEEHLQQERDRHWAAQELITDLAQEKAEYLDTIDALEKQVAYYKDQADVLNIPSPLTSGKGGRWN